MKLCIAFDGYSSTGKSSISQLIAQDFGLYHIDSGALYRLITLAALQQKCDIPSLSGEFLLQLPISYQKKEGLLYFTLDGKTYTDEIRSSEVNANVSAVAALPEVRDYINSILRTLSEEEGIVMDGRDIGTIVLPNADLKFFMTASLEKRAGRRYKELKEKGSSITYDEVAENLCQRDHADSTRSVAPLVPATDAIIIDNTALDKDQTHQLIKKYIQEFIEDS